MKKDEKYWATSFHLSPQAKKVIKEMADRYRVSQNAMVNLLLTGRIQPDEDIKEELERVLRNKDFKLGE